MSTNRFNRIPGAEELPVAKATPEKKTELPIQPSQRTSLSVDSRISHAISAILLLKKNEEPEKKNRSGKEEFVNVILKKELKKLLKEFDITTLKTLGVDTDFFEL